MKKQIELSERLSSKGFFLIGILFGAVAAAVAMLLSALILLVLDLNRSLAAPLATVSVSLGAFVAAFYNAYKMGDKGYLVGLITGGSVFLTILAVSMAITETGFTVNTLFHLIIMLLSGVIGGIWGVNRRVNKKYL